VALKGRPPIGKPIQNLRILFHPYSPGSRFQATHVLFTKAWADQHGIKTLADVAAKKPPMRVAVNRPGNLDGDVALALLAAHGITPDSIRGSGGQLVRAASQEITSLMLDRRLDGTVYGISYNHATIREMANGLPLAMLPVRAEAADKVAQDLGAETCAFKAADYAFLNQDTPSVCVGMSVVVRADMDPQLAYNITKGVFENIDKYKAAHRLLGQAVTAQTMSQKGLTPFHPGAEKYLREKGLLK
jgi:TRAP transporter TAXI family solute receptor